MASKFDSEGYDLDKVSTCDDGGETILEIGGKVSELKAAIKTPIDIEDPVHISEKLKQQGNEKFKLGDYYGAYDLYSDAISSCPGMTGDEILKLRDEFDAKEKERFDEHRRVEHEKRRRMPTKEKTELNEDKEVVEFKGEIFSPPPHPNGAKLAVYHSNRAACLLHQLRHDDALLDCDVAILLNPFYVKALLRRMAAFEALGKIENALKDAKLAYKLEQGNIQAKNHAARLKKIDDERLNKLKEETMGKLKDLGNNILGNFGLSLDNFNAVKDPNTGGYSISFDNK